MENHMNELPAWYSVEKVAWKLDAREMLQRGEHPLSIVMSKVQELESGSIIELITSFVPGPLIEKVQALGCESYTTRLTVEEFHTYFCKH